MNTKLQLYYKNIKNHIQLILLHQSLSENLHHLHHWNTSSMSHTGSDCTIYHDSALEFNKQRTLEDCKYENGLISNLQNGVVASSGHAHLLEGE